MRSDWQRFVFFSELGILYYHNNYVDREIYANYRKSEVRGGPSHIFRTKNTVLIKVIIHNF